MTAKTCYACRSGYRSWAEHATTKKHRERTTSVRSTGPKGSHAYRPPAVMPASDADYDAELARRFIVVPSIDTVFPYELMDKPPERPKAERGSKPDPCPRCGAQQRTPAGAAWHRDNNPYCEKWTPAKRRLLQ